MREVITLPEHLDEASWSNWRRTPCYAETPLLIRDLLWLLSSPTLMTETPGMRLIEGPLWGSSYEQTRHWIEGLLAEPEPLREHPPLALSPPPHQVGLYLEQLLLWWLRGASPYALLAHNLQLFGLREGRRETLGALDLLLRNPRGDTEHWELAIKFYLEASPSGRWPAWVGANERDNLARKLGHMRRHQLPLSRRPEALTRFRELGVTAPVARRALLRGFFFSAPKSRGGGIASPRGGGVVPFGRWLYPSALPGELSRWSTARWKILPRPHWMSPTLCAQQESLDSDELAHWNQSLSPQKRRTAMVARLERAMENDPEGAAAWVEAERLIIVSERWGRGTEGEKRSRRGRERA